MSLDRLKDGISSAISTGKTILGTRTRQLAGAAVGVVGLGAATALGLAAIKRKGRRSSRSRKGRARDIMFRSKQKHEVRYKRKRKYKVYGKKSYQKPSGKSRGRVHYARKTGQPYIILANGRAKFIKGKRRK